MNCREDYDNDVKTLELTGSQINLTSRSDQTVSGSSCNRNSRPCSATFCCRRRIGRTCTMRPKSAEYFPSTPAINQHKRSGNPPLPLSNFTDSSSKLLQNLLNNYSSKPNPALEHKSADTDKLSPKSGKNKSEMSVEDKKLQAESSVEYLTADHLSVDSELQKGISLRVNPNLENIKVRSGFPEVVEEKIVRFYDTPRERINTFSDNKFTEHDSYCRSSGKVHSCLKNSFKLSYQEPHICQTLTRTISEPKVLKLDDERTIKLSNQNEREELKTFNFNNRDDYYVYKSKDRNEEVISQDKCSLSPEESCNKNYAGTETLSNKLYSPPYQSNMEFNDTHIKDEHVEKFERLADISDEEIQEEFEENNKADEEGLKRDNGQKTDSTYEEIVNLLQALEEDDSDSMNLDIKRETDVHNPAERVSSEEKIDYLSAVSSYLEEVERDDRSLQENHDNTERWNFASPRLEDLLNKNSVELAHEVFSLKIQIEDQKKGIKLLKDTLAEQKEAKKALELEHQEALHKVSSEAETLVQRHQKFIKQLLNEKKNLNETVSKLVQDLKSGEDRYKRNIKAMEEKHLVEIKRAKETQAAADKIKREKWMESKTQKIKEMTVKGLEPELSRMALRQQEELTELRNLQKAELEAVELRAARRTSELMDELRAELTKEKERAIAKELANLRSFMEKEFEDERNKLQQCCQTLKERNRKQEEKFSNQEFEFQQRLVEFRQEEEKKRQKIIREHQDNLEEVKRQHLVELKNLKESLEVEKEIFVNNYKKQQASNLLEKEAEIRQQFKKERDREIELIIETLEKESSQIQADLTAACESKLKRLKDKMEAEIKEVEASEEALKIKLSDTKSKLSEKEDCVTELNSQIRQLQTELTFFKKSSEEMSSEKAKLKEVVRGEFESTINNLIKEKENLKKEILVIKELHSKELAKKDQQNAQAKCEMQKELTRVYSRIKTAVNKKEKIIESLREENGATNQRCRQLEYMLDQQRRNLLLQ